MGFIAREHAPLDGIRIDTDPASSTAVKFGPYTEGVLRLPAGATTQDIDVHAAETESGTYAPLYDNAATPVIARITGAQASRAYQLPDAAKGALWIKFVAATADIADCTLALKG